MTTLHLSADEARRTALAAQGFGGPALKRTAGISHLRSLASRLHAFQIDPINVLVRAQYMPAYSRLGPYPADALDELAYKRRELFEYVGHQASFLRMDLYPLMRWRMEGFKKDRRWVRDIPPAYVDAVLNEVAEHGPIGAADLSDKGKRTGGVWKSGHGREVLGWLNASGQVAVAGRRGIQQLYDLPERVIPRAVLDVPGLGVEEAVRELLVLSAGALGVGTAADLADYFNIGSGIWGVSQRVAYPAAKGVKQVLADLVEDGRLLAAKVEGWTEPAYAHPLAKTPRRVDARAVVSPFDPLLWERNRMARLFGFHYRIEIYVPEPQRKHGYYVLPFLLGDRLVARVDLKADRKRKALVALGAFAEEGVDRRQVAQELAEELRRMAAWSGMERVEVGGRGDLAKELKAALRSKGARKDG